MADANLSAAATASADRVTIELASNNIGVLLDRSMAGEVVSSGLTEQETKQAASAKAAARPDRPAHETRTILLDACFYVVSKLVLMEWILICSQLISARLEHQTCASHAVPG